MSCSLVESLSEAPRAVKCVGGETRAGNVAAGGAEGFKQCQVAVADAMLWHKYRVRRETWAGVKASP